MPWFSIIVFEILVRATYYVSYTRLWDKMLHTSVIAFWKLNSYEDLFSSVIVLLHFDNFLSFVTISNVFIYYPTYSCSLRSSSAVLSRLTYLQLVLCVQHFHHIISPVFLRILILIIIIYHFTFMDITVNSKKENKAYTRYRPSTLLEI